MVAATDKVKLPKLTVGKVQNVRHDLLNRNFNIRSQDNVQKVDDILPSIREFGVQEPIHVNKEGVNLDGARRLHCCDILAQERGVEGIEVPILVLDIPEKDIPAYQYRTMLRKGITPKEINAAIYNHVLRNPEQSEVEIAAIFSTTKQVVNQASKIIRANVMLKDLIVEGLLSQNVGLALIDYTLGDRTVDEMDEADRKKIAAVVDILDADIRETLQKARESGEEFKPWDLRKVNTLFQSKGLAQIPSTKDKGSSSRVNIKKVYAQFFEGLQLTPSGDNYQISGLISKDVIETILRNLEDEKKGEISEETFTEAEANESGIWGVWAQYSKKNDIVFVQYSSVKWATYDHNIDIVAEYTTVKESTENGGRILILTKPEMNAAIKQMVDKGIDVVKLVATKEKASGRGRKKKGTVIEQPQELETETESTPAENTAETETANLPLEFSPSFNDAQATEFLDNLASEYEETEDEE